MMSHPNLRPDFRPDPAWDAPAPGAEASAVCIGCGCDWDDACYDESTRLPCHWVRLDAEAGKGLCSCCAELEEAWDLGDREFRVPLELYPSAIGGTVPAEALTVPVGGRPVMEASLAPPRPGRTGQAAENPA